MAAVQLVYACLALAAYFQLRKRNLQNRTKRAKKTSGQSARRCIQVLKTSPSLLNISPSIQVYIRCEQYISADKSTYFVQRRSAVAERQLPPRLIPTNVLVSSLLHSCTAAILSWVTPQLDRSGLVDEC